MRKYSNWLSIICLALLALPATVLAEEAPGAAASAGGLIALGAGIAISVAALGGTLGQSRAISAGLEAIGRNPSAAGKVFVPMIVGLVFIESLVILSFVIAFFLQGKV